MSVFEGLYESAVGWLAALDPAVREILVATLFLLALLGAGSTGYVPLEGWYWFEGFYFTFITRTTIGFAEIHDLSVTGRVFTSRSARVDHGPGYCPGRSAYCGHIIGGEQLSPTV